MNLGDLQEFWVPEIYFSNARNVERLGTIHEKQSTSSFWYNHKHGLYTCTIVLVRSICPDMTFSKYPFDDHVCYLEMRNWLGVQTRVQFRRAKLFDDHEKNHKSRNVITFRNENLGYDFIVKSMPESPKFENGFNYSMVRNA